MALKTEKYRKYYLKCSNTFLAGCIVNGMKIPLKWINVPICYDVKMTCGD